MRFLADENIPRAVIAALAAQHGHDVSAIGEVERGANDRQIVARAEREGRISDQARRSRGQGIEPLSREPDPETLPSRLKQARR